MEFPFFGEGYRVFETLAEHRYTRIYRGTYTPENSPAQPLVFKCLNLATLPDWGVIQHLEYEAELLQGFDHPRLPALVERKEILYENQRYLCLIQQSMPGENLQQWLQQQIQLPLPEVLSIVLQTLQVLKALHGFHPAIMHLDLKPSNLMWTAVGELSLIDFGAAQSLGRPALSVVGTPGYTPNEQLSGQPLPASDIYALGATALELLSGSPAERFYDGNRLDFWSQLDIPPAYKNVLEIMLHPDPAFRFDDADQALTQWLETLKTENRPLAQELQERLQGIPDTLTLQMLQSSVPQLQQQERPPPVLDGYRFEACKSAALQRASETWWATRTTDQTPVVIKKLSLSALGNWKELTQFEREIETLSRLQHAAFPKLLAVEKQAEAWFLIQERLPGVSLKEKVEQGWRPDTLELCEWMLAVLLSLRVLHQQSPSLVHRDLQPEHILMAPDQIYLLGFGGAQQRLITPGSGGSTQTGSFGYTAPEQYLGLHSAGSDIFSLGMCALYILGQRSPASYRWENQTLDLREITLPDGLKGWLKRVTHLDPQQRHSSAEDAFAALKHQYQEIKVSTERLSSLEKQQARLEALRLSEARYTQQVQRFASQMPEQWQENPWIQALKAHHQPLPPSLRVQMEGVPASGQRAGSLTLRIGGPSPTREPHFKRLERFSKGFFIFACFVGLLGFLFNPVFLLPFIASAALMIWVHGPLKKHLCDFSIILTPETLQWQKLSNPRWQNVGGGRISEPLLLHKGQVVLRAVKPPFPLQKKYYTFDYPGVAEPPTLFLLESEKEWLETVFSWLTENVTG